MKKYKYIIILVLLILLVCSFLYLSKLKVRHDIYEVNYDTYEDKGQIAAFQDSTEESEEPEKMKQIDATQNLTAEQVFEILEQGKNDYVRRLDKRENKTTKAFLALDNPTEEQKLRAIGLNPHVLEHIENPTEEMLLKAVSIDGNAIQWLDYQPSLEIMLAAVRQKPSSVRYIYGKPPEEVLIEAVKNEGDALSKIREPSEAVILMAIYTDLEAFKSIDEPSQAVIQEKELIEAILNNPKYVQTLKNPTEEDLEHIVFIDPFSILYIESPSETLQMTALNRNWTIGKDMEDLEPMAKTFYEKMKSQTEASYENCKEEKTTKYKNAEYVEGELLVTFKLNMRDSDKIKIINDAGYNLKDGEKIRYFVVLSNIQDLEKAICELEVNPMIRYAEPNFIAHLF